MQQLHHSLNVNLFCIVKIKLRKLLQIMHSVNSMTKLAYIFKLLVNTRLANSAFTGYA